MRSICLLLIAAALGSCSTVPQPATRSPGAQRDFEAAIAGKVPGTPISCLPSYNASDMSVIDGRAVSFRAGGATTYIMHLSEGCSELGRGNTALLTRQFGSGRLCRGDIAQVIDTSSHMIVGSCVIGDIVPYTKLRTP
jgi:hypothetical protein